jgi:hypothetical protein
MSPLLKLVERRLPRKRSFTVKLDHAELNLLVEALDSHRYWQLAEEQYRNNGFVLDPGSDDPEVQAELAEVATLEEKLGSLTRRTG